MLLSQNVGDHLFPLVCLLLKDCTMLFHLRYFIGGKSGRNLNAVFQHKYQTIFENYPTIIKVSNIPLSDLALRRTCLFFLPNILFYYIFLLHP